MPQRLELIKRLRLGASISRERNLNMDFAEIADEAADELEAAGEPVAWRNMLDTVVDIYFDGTTNPEKHRTYVEGAFDEVMDEAKKLLATHPAPLVPMTKDEAEDIWNLWETGKASGHEIILAVEAHHGVKP